MLVGIDEVGYGCWAGPLFICSLKFLEAPSFELFDSKKISEKKREELFPFIEEISEYRIGIASVDEINKLGLRLAYKRALFRAIECMEGDLVIDGRKPSYLDCSAVIKGDSLIKEISAASIIAKVFRDREMKRLALEYPEYGFDANKGYGTKKHIQALKDHGFCAIHRTVYNIHKYL